MRAIRVGMAGGGLGAFIGGVHRTAMALDETMELVAGAFSSTAEKSIASGRSLGLCGDRCYGCWEDMIAGELSRPEEDRIEAVVIVTPNASHFAIAMASLDAGFHVVCDKPMVCSSTEAESLQAAQQESGRVFAVTYNYTGYPLIKQMRAMVRSGAIGVVRKVMVEYLQGWLSTPLERTGQKQAVWRNDPTHAGPAGALGDIGSHAENLVSYVTGLKINKITADVATHGEGRALDDDVSALLRFDNGATGVFAVSQICVGARNGLSLRVWGDAGGLEWHQESPNKLLHTSLDRPDTLYQTGDASLCEAAATATRLPGGHPEGFLEAFANIYRGVAEAIRAGRDDGEAFDYPDVNDGARGVRFVESVLESAIE